MLTLSGSGATEVAFLKEAPRHATLHLVTHGYFESSQVKSIRQADLSATSPASQSLQSDPFVNTWLPEMLSGLVMAGANNPSNDPADPRDGLLRAAEIEIGPRLATALLYGIKSDTQLLGRETSQYDMLSFAHLHTSYSPALLRRIERPALPIDGLRALGRALTHAEVTDGIHILVLGRVREDVIPQVADMGLQAEGAEWAIAAGIVGSDLVFSVRNVGYVRAAGDVVRAVVEDLGVGGGHRSMAKGIIPVKAFRKVYGKADRETVGRALHDAFIAAIHGDPA